MKDGSIDWRAMERTSRKTYQRRESYSKGEKTAFREMSSEKTISLILKVATVAVALRYRY